MWPGSVADMHRDLDVGANGLLGRVAQCRKLTVYRDGVHRGKLVVYRDGVHRGAARGRRSGAGGWAVGAGWFEQGG